jgi:hypothetical protein
VVGGLGEPKVIADSSMRLGGFDFNVERAEFCYIDRGLESVTWDLNIYGHCLNNDYYNPLK